MPGKIKKLIDTIITERADGNELVVHLTRAKLMLKGIDPDDYSETSQDFPDVIRQLRSLAQEIGVTLKSEY